MKPSPIRFGTFCSGIGAPEVAWGRLGWQPQFSSEIEPFPCAVLAHHHPDVPNLGDMEKITDETLGRFHVDVVCAGTPCQSFSVAGLRKGLADPRGNLALVFLGLLDRIRPRWMVWENVSGILSSDDGRCFGSFLGGLGELGYGWAYRVLDAQYFGVAQRRRRVFVVGCLGNWRGSAAVLFERHSLSGNPAPSRETGKRIASSVAACLNSGGNNGGFRTAHCSDVSRSLVPILEVGKGSSSRGAGQNGCGIGNEGDPMFTLQAGAQHAIAFAQNTRDEVREIGNNIAGALAAQPGMKQQTYVAYRTSGNRGVMEQGDRTAALTTSTDPNATIISVAQTNSLELPAVAFQVRGREAGPNVESQTELAYSLNAPSGGGRRQEMNVATPTMAVRRLTPVECERLMGFADHFTAIQFRGKLAADGPRYRALGNSMAVPVLSWIGRRIQAVEEILANKGAT